MSRDLDRRLAALAEAASLARGRLPDEAVDAAETVARRAGERIGLGVEATVAALAGPTGAGKSSLFNALVGEDVAEAGVRRPMTSVATAAVWGTAGEPLLDWLQVARRHRVSAPGLDGLVLLDLPDFDSVEASHRAEFERVIALCDLAVWIVDPQKYADASLHDRYLRPMAGHAATTVVVLNHADALAPAARESARADLSRLIAADGLDGVGVLAVSARTGEGIDRLRDVLRRRVAERTAALDRLSADVRATAGALGTGCDERARSRRIGRAERERLMGALEQAAGIPVVVDAVGRGHRRQGALATGWPVVRWVARLRPDPLRRLRLGGQPNADLRPSLPEPSAVQRAQVSTASRALAASASEGLGGRWPELVRSAATSREEYLADELRQAVAGAELPTRRPRWWLVAGALQRLLALLAGAGLVWLLIVVALGFLQLDNAVPMPEVEGLALPTLLLLGGALGGILLALFARMVNRAGSRRRQRAALGALRPRVQSVAEEQVLAPVAAELEARRRLCEAARVAAG